MQRRFKDFFSRDRKALYMILGIVLISVFSLTIVYAALSVTLNITGNSEVVASSWDIHLDNIKVTSGSVSGNSPTITSSRTASFSTTLNNPGDFYEFTIDVVNDGSIDAMIDGVSKTPTLTETQAKYLNYIVEYQNGESINTKQLVAKNSYVRLKVRVEFRKDITASDLPTTSETLNLAFTVNYVQSDGTGSSVTDNGAEKKLINVVSGDGTQKSDEVCIGEECFYVMYSDETTVTMLAKYNLYVGNECTSSDSSSCTEYGEEATGKQDSEMIGYGKTPRKGTMQFSSTASSPTRTYPAYVYNENSYLYEYVENYKTYLSTLGVTPSEARLITIEELESLGCSSSSKSCSSAPSWVYATTYWSGTALSSRNVWGVNSSGGFDISDYSTYVSRGCRPVITISRSLIDGTDSSATKQLIEFTIDDITYQAEEGMTWLEWVESEYNTCDAYISEYDIVLIDFHLLCYPGGISSVKTVDVIDEEIAYYVAWDDAGIK